MKHIVSVADMKIAVDDGDTIVTHALGSCLGISVHDPVSHVGGMFDVMLPQSAINVERRPPIRSCSSIPASRRSSTSFTPTAA